MKIFTSIQKAKRVLPIAIITILILLFFVIQSFSTDLLLYKIGLNIILVLSVIIAFGLFSFYKTRIEVDDKEIYCPCYPWYQGFKIDLNETPLFKTILFSNISSISMIDVDGLKGELERAILLNIIDKYDVVVLLDGYAKEKQQEIFDFVIKKLGK